MTKMHCSRKKFTLIELLMILSIICTLMALLVPALNNVREKSNELICLDNLSQMGGVANSYANDNNSVFPKLARFAGTAPYSYDFPRNTLKEYFDDNSSWQSIYICPSASEKEKSKLWCYAYRPVNSIDGQYLRTSGGPDKALFVDVWWYGGDHHETSEDWVGITSGGVNCVWIDGSAKFVGEPAFQLRYGGWNTTDWTNILDKER